MDQDIAYCFNPYCLHPETAANHQRCNNCGFDLTIQQQYQARALIASGRFGRTFLGKDLYQQRPCVIKQFFPQNEQGILLNSRKAIQLFHSEARRLQQLGDHPQIPQLYDHIEQEGYHYIIQEWIDGENLARELSRRGAFSERDIRKLLTSLLPVLQYIHDHRVIHRDIKPNNIIRRDDDPEFVLVDFGAAKLASLSELGKTGTIIGSPGYAAPEQVYGKATFASDLYSLGVTCLHLLTEVSPFELYNPLDNQLQWRDYYCQDLPISDSLAAILDGMTAFDLKERYTSANAVLSALGVLSSLPASPSPSQPPPNVNQTPPVIKVNSGKGAIYSLDFSPNGDLLATAGGADWGKFIGKDNCVRLWDVGNWEYHRKLTEHAAPIAKVVFSRDGEFLISGSRDKTIKVWNLTSQQLQQTLKGHRFEINTVQLSPYQDILLSGSVGGEILLWNWQTGRVLDRLSLEPGTIKALAISPDGEYFAVASGDSTIQLWEVYGFKPVFSLKGHTDAVTSLAFSPDGKYLASGSGDWDCSLKIWELSTQTLRQTLREHQWAVNAVEFSPDGKYLASASSDKTVKVIEILKDKPVKCSWSRYHGAVNTVAFSPDGTFLASGSDDETLRIWRWQQSMSSSLTRDNSPILSSKSEETTP
jgi:WD40 repeat protein/tRNA A-37 threonylcarbamoyl transferase component Bud32